MQRQTKERSRAGEKRAIIVSGGLLERDHVLGVLKEQPYTYLIGADAGLAFLYEEGIEPTHIVGDFDSLRPDVLDHYVNDPNVTIRMFSPIKDKTDTEIALRLCVELGATDIWLLGGNGKRVDHTIGNIQSLAIPLSAGIPCVMADAHNQIRLLDKGVFLSKGELFGKYLSLFPFDETVENLTVTGVKYPLRNHTLVKTDSLGVSNEVTGLFASISFSKGRLIMIMAKD